MKREQKNVYIEHVHKHIKCSIGLAYTKRRLITEI